MAEARVTIPHEFTNGKVAEMVEVNANFSALADALDVTVPNSFANSEIADANEVSTFFNALKTAVDLFTTELTTAPDATQAAGDNACGNAIGNWDGVTSSSS